MYWCSCRTGDRRQFQWRRFFDCTAYGDTINIAARLETANKQLGTRICVGAILAAKVKDFRGHPVEDLWLRGRSERPRAHRVSMKKRGLDGDAGAAPPPLTKGAHAGYPF